MHHGPPTDDQRAAFGAALTRAMQEAGTRSPAVAEAFDVSDVTVRKWATGAALPANPTTVFALEGFLGLSPGELSRHLGFRPLDSGVSVLDAIGADPALDDNARRILASVYVTVRAG